ncbi:hypothetical protein MRX96_012204 [Rhipicephalus microplus]
MRQELGSCSGRPRALFAGDNQRERGVARAATELCIRVGPPFSFVRGHGLSLWRTLSILINGVHGKVPWGPDKTVAVGGVSPLRIACTHLFCREPQTTAPESDFDL